MSWKMFGQVLFALAAFSTVNAQSSMIGPKDGKDLAPTDIERIAVGQAAPDFTLSKYGGGTVTLSQYKGTKNVVLVFYRGYWCPYCISQLTDLRTLLDAELKKNAELIVVSVEGANETRQTIARISRDGVQPDFTFLTDSASAVIGRYGILNPSGTKKGIPHPATFIIDKAGIVRWKDVETDYKIRPSRDAVLKALKSLGQNP